MISTNIPGHKIIEVKNVVFDFNGTIAEDGILIPGVEKLIKELVQNDIKVYVLTADTNGSVKKQCVELPVEIEIFDRENASMCKKEIVERIGGENTVSIGNGKNDIEMFKSSILSIAIIGKEGCYSKTFIESDIVVKSIIDAIELILKPNRLRATMRA